MPNGRAAVTYRHFKELGEVMKRLFAILAGLAGSYVLYQLVQAIREDVQVSKGQCLVCGDTKLATEELWSYCPTCKKYG